MHRSLNITILGLSITSSWGNPHASTYRNLVKALRQRGHQVNFLERDAPWFASHRDLLADHTSQVTFYQNLDDLFETSSARVREADLVIVGSSLADGIELAGWVQREAQGVTAFYDLDTPVTLAALSRGECPYLTAGMISHFDCYLSSTGGPVLRRIEQDLGAPLARALYCSADPERFYPTSAPIQYDLGYLGTGVLDRNSKHERMLLDVAHHWESGRFVIAGVHVGQTVSWPRNLEVLDDVTAEQYCEFFNSQQFTLNLTRGDLIEAGYTPTARLFEAAACGIPIISDYWKGIDEFFVVGREILMSDGPAQMLQILTSMPQTQRDRVAQLARQAVLKRHTPTHRAQALEAIFLEAASRSTRTTNTISA